MEIEAFETGLLARILTPEGAEVPVNAPIALIESSGVPEPAPLPAPEPPPREITVREALREALAEEMRRNPNVFTLGEEVGDYQGAFRVTHGLLQEFGARRVVDAPIAENGFAGLGVGAAMAGLRPVIEFMSFNFALHAMDQIVNSAAKTLYMSGGAVARRRPARAGFFGLVRAHSRSQGRRALYRRRRQGPAQGGDPGP
jgi:pyruvate dehydrogenase E1 component beta subunit